MMLDLIVRDHSHPNKNICFHKDFAASNFCSIKTLFTIHLFFLDNWLSSAQYIIGVMGCFSNFSFKFFAPFNFGHHTWIFRCIWWVKHFVTVEQLCWRCFSSLHNYLHLHSTGLPKVHETPKEDSEAGPSYGKHHYSLFLLDDLPSSFHSWRAMFLYKQLKIV